MRAQAKETSKLSKFNFIISITVIVIALLGVIEGDLRKGINQIIFTKKRYAYKRKIK